MPNKKVSTKKAKAKQIRIDRVNPDSIRSVPINDVIVSHTQNEFFITFSSVEPPSILDEQDFEKLSAIEAITRAKIVVPPEFVEAIIKALTTNLENFKKRGK